MRRTTASPMPPAPVTTTTSAHRARRFGEPAAEVGDGREAELGDVVDLGPGRSGALRQEVGQPSDRGVRGERGVGVRVGAAELRERLAQQRRQ